MAIALRQEGDDHHNVQGKIAQPRGDGLALSADVLADQSPNALAVLRTRMSPGWGLLLQRSLFLPLPIISLQACLRWNQQESAMDASLFSNTPAVTVFDGRGLTVRGIEYHRHPETPGVGTVRITHHRYDGRGLLARSADPRLHEAGLANFIYQTDLRGSALRTRSADAGTSQTLNDIAGRPLLAVSSIRTDEHDEDDHSQAVWRTWRYEGSDLPGRLISVADQMAGEEERISERLLYAGNTAAEKGLNLAGQCVSHYETAGLLHTDSIALIGVPLSVTRLLLKDADNPDIVAHWQGEDVGDWDALLAAQAYITQSQADATGMMLSTIDAVGHQQRMAYDVAGLLAGSWLTLKGGKEQAIVISLQYSAAGQKLRETHGNGVVTTYTYEARTQRLSGITALREKDAKVLQDLRYAFDPVGNVVSVRNDAHEARFWHNQKVVPESRYHYDSLYQLVSAEGREMANAGQQGPQLPPVKVPIPIDNSAYTNYTRTYRYDNAGNLTQIRHSPATGTGYTTDVTISDRSNRGVLSSLTDKPAEVDALFTAGGQQTLLQPGQPLSWTPRLELLRVNGVTRAGAEDDRESYRYDSGSQRILKAGIWEASGSMQTKHTLYLPGLELQTKAVGGTQIERLQVIIMGEAGRAQVRVLHWEHGKPGELENDQVRYGLNDLVDSSCIELDGEGAILSCEEYYPYGGTAILAARSEVEANYKSIRYSGKERDETGLYYYGYRYYQPWAGRWLAVDPAGPVEGLNLFKMVGNSPLTYRDTDGRIRVESAQGNAAPPSAGPHLLAPQKPTGSSPLSAEGVFEKFKDRYGRADSVARRVMAFEILEEVTRNKPDLKEPTPAKNTINGVGRKFTLRHYTTATNGQPPFSEIASNFDLVHRGIKKLNRESGSTSNTNPADWAELGNTGFTFFLLAIDGVVSDRGFLSGSSHYAEIDIEDAAAMKSLGLDDVDFFASGDLLPLKNNLQSAKAVRGKLSDLKSILLERTGERGLALKVLQPHQLLQKIESKFDKNFEIKIPGNVKVKTWHKKT